MVMKKIMLFLVTGLLLVSFQGKAAALSFVLDEYDVVINESDPGLKLYWDPILSMPAVLDLEEGETSDAFSLFRIGTDEDYANLDDLWPKDISVSFDFSSPDISNEISGFTRGRFVFDDGVVRWFGPTDFYFGDTGHFRIELLDASFGLPGSADVLATITYVHADTAARPVPEPASVFLLGLGLLALVGVGRKRYLAT